MPSSHQDENFVQRLKEFVDSNYKQSSHGMSISVDQGSKNHFEYSVGEIQELNFKYSNSTIYDLASLTKPLVTAMLTMKFLESGKLALEDSLSSLGIFKKEEVVGNLTVRSLLSHSSGLIPDYPLYSFGHDRPSYLKAIAAVGHSNSRPAVEQYSDLNYILIGFILEELSGLSLDKLMAREILNPLGLKHSAFNPDYHRSEIAPTEITKDRGQVWGKVHDEKSYWLGGVAGHAGLFSNLEDVRKLLLNFTEGKILSKKTIALMTSPANLNLGGTFGFGWMIKLPRPVTPSLAFDYSLFIGDYADYGVIGHTGFTGTSVCIDLKNKISVIILSNRVYPSRENIGILRFRRLFHNLVFGSLPSRESI